MAGRATQVGAQVLVEAPPQPHYAKVTLVGAQVLVASSGITPHSQAIVTQVGVQVLVSTEPPPGPIPPRAHIIVAG